MATEHGEQTAGGNTNATNDDEYLITGSFKGINQAGVHYDLTVAKALHIAPSCKWIKGGTMNLVFDGGPQQQIVFGDDVNPVCDDQAQLIIDGTTLGFTMK